MSKRIKNYVVLLSIVAALAILSACKSSGVNLEGLSNFCVNYSPSIEIISDEELLRIEKVSENAIEYMLYNDTKYNEICVDYD